MVHSSDGNANFFDIVTRVMQGNTWALDLFIISLDYILQTSIDLIKGNNFPLKNTRSRQYFAKTIPDADYTIDLARLANRPTQTESWLHSQNQVARGIGLYVNANKTEFLF